MKVDKLKELILPILEFLKSEDEPYTIVITKTSVEIVDGLKEVKQLTFKSE